MNFVNCLVEINSGYTIFVARMKFNSNIGRKGEGCVLIIKRNYERAFGPSNLGDLASYTIFIWVPSIRRQSGRCAVKLHALQS